MGPYRRVATRVASRSRREAAGERAERGRRRSPRLRRPSPIRSPRSSPSHLVPRISPIFPPVAGRGIAQVVGWVTADGDSRLRRNLSMNTGVAGKREAPWGEGKERGREEMKREEDGPISMHSIKGKESMDQLPVHTPPLTPPILGFFALLFFRISQVLRSHVQIFLILRSPNHHVASHLPPLLDESKDNFVLFACDACQPPG